MGETNTQATTAAESFVVDPARLRRSAREQVSDPTQPSYYAARGAGDRDEQQMRADYMRAVRLRDEGMRSEEPAEFENLFALADALRDRWRDHESPVVRENWEYLTDAASDWRRTPGAMEQLYEQVSLDRVDGYTTGMSPAQWRSQRQAREMAGHGQWKELRNPFGIESARSRSDHPADPANPNYYAGTASTWAEQVMRADFARVHQLGQERGRTITDTEYQQVTEQMLDISEPWIDRDDVFGREWRDMRALSLGDYYSPLEFEAAVERLEQARPETLGENAMFTRSVEQVGELNGLARRYLSVDASHTPQPVASSAFAAARTAELRQCGRAPIPGHAFADLVGGREREGIER